MKNFQNRSLLITVSLVALLSFSLVAHAQGLTEALQKQSWPGAGTWSLDAWDNLLPQAGADTVVYAATHTAECVQLDTLGYPSKVTVLQRRDDRWVPMTQTVATFDEGGRLVQLQSWAFLDGAWENESLSSSVQAHDGSAQIFQFDVWENHAWESAHELQAVANDQAITLNR